MGIHGAEDSSAPGACRSRDAPDWLACIRARLAGSAPNHAVDAWLIPGLTTEASQRLRRYFPTDPVPAAVLVPLIERDCGTTVLLTQRATQLRNHPGQVSFPGGRCESPAEGAREAALREAREEIGLDPALISVIGYLPDHIVISGFRVTPVVAVVQGDFELQLDTHEVQDTFEVPLAYVFRPENHHTRLRRFGSNGHFVEVEMHDIPYGERHIWGATAGILITLYRLCALGAPA